MSDWKEWFDGQVAASTMRVEEVSLSEVGGGWGLQDEGQRFGRQDGKFFDLVGVKITTGEREVRSWGQPLLREASGPGVVVLGYRPYPDQDGAKYLVSAKPEPGNDTSGCLILAPSLQASLSNLEQAHGGKRPPRAELFDQVSSEGWRTLRKDGARFLNKTDRYAVMEVEPDIELTPNERWFTMGELLEAADEGLLNEHLVSALAFGVFLV